MRRHGKAQLGSNMNLCEPPIGAPSFLARLREVRGFVLEEECATLKCTTEDVPETAAVKEGDPLERGLRSGEVETTTNEHLLDRLVEIEAQVIRVILLGLEKREAVRVLVDLSSRELTIPCDAVSFLDRIYELESSAQNADRETVTFLREAGVSTRDWRSLAQKWLSTTMRTRVSPSFRKRLVALEAEESAIRGELVDQNIRLVAWELKRLGRGRLTERAALRAGTVGLDRAIRNFDPDQETKLSTYAFHWIRQRITRAKEMHSRGLRVPSYLLDVLRRLLRGWDEAVAKGTAHEGKASLTAWSVDAEYRNVFFLLRPIARPESGMPLSRERLVEHLPDPEHPAPLVELVGTWLSSILNKEIKGLSPRLQTIFLARTGFGRTKQETLLEVGNRIGLSRERIRQIETDAYRKLANRMRGKLSILLDDC